MASSTDGSEFVPITPNPFIVGNPVRSPSMFFGRRDEFEFVKKRFQQTERGGLLIFCGERRSGKTSILFQILEGRLGPEFIPILIDMQSMAIQNEADFLKKIAREIHHVVDPKGNTIQIPDFHASDNPTGAFHEFIEEVLELDPERKPILLFDEYELLENKIDSGVLSDDVLHILSHLIQHYAVFMVFTGSEHLELRRRDYWRILGTALHTRISYLSQRDAAALITEPVKGKVRYADGTIDDIFRLTAGQPFYTQGICQSLVDTLNERRTNAVSSEILHDVVEQLVENPFPQMLFLWDGFSTDEKIVLSLLAESLDSTDRFQTAHDLLKLRSKRSYPLRLELGNIATTLEGLFKKEFLLRDQESPAGYAFRMDLWRLWVRRMHSVWQVVRELGLPTKRSPRIHPALYALGAALLLTASFLAGRELLSRQESRPVASNGAPISAGESREATVVLSVLPASAAILRDDVFVGRDRHPLRLQWGDSHRVDLRAEGYVDSTLMVSLGDSGACQDPSNGCFLASAGDTTITVELLPRRGAVQISVLPSSATIDVDGTFEGTGEALVRGLEVPEMHQLSVSASGHIAREFNFAVFPDSVLPIRIALDAAVYGVRIESNPRGVRVQIAGQPAKPTPDVWDLPHGNHQLRLTHPGFAALDTVISVTKSQTLAFSLQEESPGYVLIIGRELADAWLGGSRVCRQNRGSGIESFPPGWYSLRVHIHSTAESIQDSLLVEPGELVTYNWSTREVTRSPYRGE
jgi:hypothetical protein